MLHMVVNTHNPESCAFRGKAEDERLSGALDRLLEASPDRVLQVSGSWINRAGHEFFLLVEAPNAHVIEDALVGADLLGQTHTRILPVLPADQVEVPS